MALKDPQEALTVALCMGCGGEIYEGDEVRRIREDGALVHNNGVCDVEFAFDSVYDAEGFATVGGYIE
ncbi:hypothetical protein PACILC2_22290 [Paenibacillus cisolokensis]|uniref:Uncharacterized protein n=1 Tax=Paenibacillus cisolokensis TaxID=1658519 RepID=A0ABQ4N6X8_9BACL|nr:hypothetical protein [Paenibacillus cisolokensis]GIQ63661.1 hypothetical protein PACILC2_22290 [Paenibacillus cisolokensis]